MKRKEAEQRRYGSQGPTREDSDTDNPWNLPDEAWVQHSLPALVKPPPSASSASEPDSPEQSVRAFPTSARRPQSTNTSLVMSKAAPRRFLEPSVPDFKDCSAEASEGNVLILMDSRQLQTCETIISSLILKFSL